MKFDDLSFSPGQFATSDQATSDLHRSLMVLTNSFHDLCNSSVQQQQQQSKSLLTLHDFSHPSPGLYRPLATSMTEAGPSSPCLEPGESTTGTCRTGNTTTTSGLGSSLNPSATANADLGAGQPSRTEPSAQVTVQRNQSEATSSKNGLKVS